MEEEKKEIQEAEVKNKKTKEVSKEKKNTFTLIYILVGIFAIAVIAMLAYAFIVTR